MKDTYLGIEVDYSRDSQFSDSGSQRLKEGYMAEGETSPQHRFAFVSKAFSTNPEHAQRLYDYSSKFWLSYATPILAYGKNKKGLPISCFLSKLDDTIESILDTSTETRMLAIIGGGVGLHIGLRSGDKKSSGVMPHLKTYDMDTLAFKQGSTRRGATAAYLDISHPEILEFLETRKPTGGDPNRKCLNIHHGINITDDFMSRVESLSTNSDLTQEEKVLLDRWELIDPHSKEIKEVVSVKDLWTRILETRMQTGEPYLWFIDSANKEMPEFQKNIGLRNNGSNLCLDGDTIIRIKDPETLVEENVKLSDFVEKFNFGYYTNQLVYSKGSDGDIWAIVSDAKQTGFTDELYEIETPAGNIIRCTADHEIFTKNRGYVSAKNLNENDELEEMLGLKQKYLLEPQYKLDLKIKKIKLEKEIPVYDITVPETSNFFANNILVHNCSEISQGTSADRVACCCLSSVNLEKWEEWKDDPLFIADIVEMLDNVLSVFIDSAKKYPEIKRAVNSAVRERSIGIGALGWHALLQSKMIAFESPMATGLNKRIFSLIKKQAKDKTEQLAEIRGECLDFTEGNKDKNIKPVRNSHLLAIAPNASSSIILNTSPSVEPYRANIYSEKGVNGTKTHKNPYLEKLLESYGKNTPEVWAEIISNDGSVKSLSFLSENEKDTFKTGPEIDQLWVIQHAADRQEYICQAQSINLFFTPDVDVEYLHYAHLLAWQTGLKSLYYCRSDSIRKADKLGKSVERQRIEDLKEIAAKAADGESICIACEG